MIKTLLFSYNSKISKKIKNALDKKEFNIQSIDKMESFNSFPNDVKLIILDIIEERNKGKNKIIDILKNTEGIDVAKIIILDSNQIDLLLENEIKFDDFCFCSQIDNELTSRIKIVLLKRNIYPPKNSIIIGKLALNLDKYELSVNGNPVELTYKEFELLKLLLKNQNKVFTRNKLLSVIWEYDFYGGSRTIDVHIRRLRSKIPSPYNLMLKTVRNVGYMFSSQT